MKLQSGLSLFSLVLPSFSAPTYSSLGSLNTNPPTHQPLIKLKPQITPSRDLINLDGLWNFALAPETNETASWTAPLPKGLECPVPASYNDIFTDQAIHDHVGWVIYQREVVVPRGWMKGDRYLVRAEAATHKGRIYVNDEFLVEHQGGYTPFEADISHLVAAGEKFRLTIAVDNTLTYSTLPPGMVTVSEVTGKKTQTYMHDFYNYAGLARSVWLYSVPEQHVTDVTIVTGVDGETGLIDYSVELSSNSTSQVKISVVDEAGIIVANSTGSQGTIRIDSVQLWQPGAAYLYQVEVSIVDSSNQIIDTYSVATGVRTIEVKGKAFLINGQPFYFTGFGAHEDSEVRGKGFDPVYMVHDFELRAWMGANSFRTSHYPYAEEIMHYADRQGIVIIDETPAVGLSLSLMGGVAGEGASTWGPDGLDTQSAHEQAIRELISRDKNHASVVMWVIANEPAAEEEGAHEYFEPLAKLTRRLDPSRPIAYANQGAATFETDLIADLFDVNCLNRYFGWYSQTGDLEAAEKALEEELRGWADKFDRPIVMTEYGADTIAGLHSVASVPFSEEFQVDMLEMYHRVFDRIPAMAGEHVWNFADFQTSVGIRRVDGNKKGVFTRDRKPKAAARSLKTRWTGREAKE